MELVLSARDLEPLPKRLDDVIIPLEDRGLLNTNYKNIARKNYSNINSNNVFAVKQRVKSRQYQFTSGIETVLKLTVFVTVFSIIFS